MGGTDYGIDPASGGDFNASFSQVLSYSSSTAVTSVGSYTASITDVLSNTVGLEGDLSAFGISSKDSFTSAETTTTSSDWTVTLQSSYTATAQSSTSVTGSFDDHHGQKGDGTALPLRPHVEVYQDNLFGSLMFLDPSARGAPVMR